MEALAPPQHGEQPRREGVTLNRMVAERPLSRSKQPSSHAEGQSSRAPLGYQEVMRSFFPHFIHYSKPWHNISGKALWKLWPHHSMVNSLGERVSL